MEEIGAADVSAKLASICFSVEWDLSLVSHQKATSLLQQLFCEHLTDSPPASKEARSPCNMTD